MSVRRKSSLVSGPLVSGALPPLVQSHQKHPSLSEFSLVGAGIEGKVVASTSPLEGELIAARQQIASLKHALETEKGRNDSCRRTISDLNAQITKLTQAAQLKSRPKSSVPPTTTTTEFSKQEKQLQDECQQLREQIQHQTDQIQSLHQSLNSTQSNSQSELSILQSKNAQLTVDCRTLREDLIKKTEQILALSQTLELQAVPQMPSTTTIHSQTDFTPEVVVKNMSDEERQAFELRLEKLYRQMVQATGESLGLKEELRQEKQKKKTMEADLDKFRAEILEMQSQLAFLQQALKKMAEAKVARCSRCDHLEGQIEQYRSAIKQVADSVTERERELERRQ